MKKLRHKELTINNLSKAISLEMLRRELKCRSSECRTVVYRPAPCWEPGSESRRKSYRRVLTDTLIQWAFPQEGGPYSADVR